MSPIAGGSRRRPVLRFVVGLLTVVSCGSHDEPDTYVSSLAQATGNPLLSYENLDRMWEFDVGLQNDLVASCMREAGFEYERQPPSEDYSPLRTNLLEPGTDEFIQTYGLGISTQVFFERALPADLVGISDDFLDASNSEVTNLPTSDAQSLGSSQAYFDALTSEGGCYEQAILQAFGTTIDFRSKYQTELDQLRESTRNDPRVVERDDSLRACVLDAGVDGFVSLDDAVLKLTAEADRLNFASGTEEAPVDQPISPEIAADLRELQQRELLLARTIHSCDGEILATDSLFLSVYSEYELEFVELYLAP